MDAVQKPPASVVNKENSLDRKSEGNLKTIKPDTETAVEDGIKFHEQVAIEVEAEMPITPIIETESSIDITDPEFAPAIDNFAINEIEDTSEIDTIETELIEPKLNSEILSVSELKNHLEVEGQTTINETVDLNFEIEDIVAVEPEEVSTDELFLENLSQGQAEIVTNLVNEITEKFQVLDEIDDETEEFKIANEEIEELCIEVFEHLGIELDKAELEEFIAKLIYEEIEVDISKSDNLTEISDLGTREKKILRQLLLSNISQIIKHNASSLLLLGKYAVNSCSALPQLA